MKPTYEQLEAKCEQLEALVKKLLERIEFLEGKLNKNSKNSSKPPSSDQKSDLPVVPKKETRPFHPGASRELLPESMVTSRTKKQIHTCPRCRSQMALTGDVVKWQQIELPEIKPLVHQWELHVCQCPKCHLVVTPQLEQEEQYLLGPRLEALINLCLSRYRIGHLMIREWIATLMPGINLSQGLVSKIKWRAAQALDDPYQQIIERVLEKNGPIHIDATGWRHMGVNEHAIVMRVGNSVAFFFVTHQNKATFSKLIPKQRLHIVSDRGLAVSGVGARLHQYCLAHLLRNIQGLAEYPSTNLSETQKLGELHEGIQKLFTDQHRMQRGEIEVTTWRQYGYGMWQWIEEQIEELIENLPNKKLYRALKKIKKDLPKFKVYLRSKDYPMTNNPAEQALRALVIARKLCFGSRSGYGRFWRAAIQSCVETLMKEGGSILDFLTDAIRSHRYRSQSSCP